ncbi:MAG TPA: transposase, partial [Clostridia bacterium]|nr:transposase [Clostridia bacterium]
MKTKAKQLSLADIYIDVQSFFEEDKPKFIKLFDSFIDLSELIPPSFYAHYYSHFGRHRDFSLESMLTALIIQKILSIPTVQLLVHVLKLSKELRELCGFKRVPHPSQFSRFKSIFLKDLENFFNNLVNLTE